MIFPDQPIPEHVPPQLVKNDFPLIFGLSTTRDPFDDLAREVHEGPEIIYAPHAYPGGTAAWVPRRMEHLRAIYLDNVHFSSAGFSPFAKLVGGNWMNLPVELDPARTRAVSPDDQSRLHSESDGGARRQDQALRGRLCRRPGPTRRMRIHE